MKNPFPVFIFAILVIAIDFYAFKSLRLVTSSWNNAVFRIIAHIFYVMTSVMTYGILIYMFTHFSRDVVHHVNYYFFYMGFGLVLLFLIPKLVIAIFHVFDDIVDVFKRLLKFFIQNPETQDAPGNLLTRWQFISKMGWLLAILPFTGMLYGMIRGRYAFRVIRQDLTFPNFPASANGLKIVQISDIHIGSFFNDHEAVQRGFDMVNSLDPDIILFTGDMINNFASETDGFEEAFKSLKAKYGKYSILGNHDYGDYVNWESGTARAENIERLKEFQNKIGFKLLLNEWVPFITPDGERIEIIGVENWGDGGFTKYGDLDKAMKGTNSDNFQILMSHDPSHFEAEVLGKTKIDLTLSGHTHGMQFGVEIPGIIKWSPVQYRYKRWGGLYKEGAQKIYVNRGFGYIGFPGRVGMPPEITLLELNRS